MHKLKTFVNATIATMKNIIHFRITKPAVDFIKAVNWFRILGDIVSTILFVGGMMCLVFLVFKVYFWKTLFWILVGGGLVTAAMYAEIYFASLGNTDED